MLRDCHADWICACCVSCASAGSHCDLLSFCQSPPAFMTLHITVTLRRPTASLTPWTGQTRRDPTQQANCATLAQTPIQMLRWKQGDHVLDNNLEGDQSPQRLVQTFRLNAGKIQLQICTYIKNTCIKNTNKIQLYYDAVILHVNNELNWAE